MSISLPTLDKLHKMARHKHHLVYGYNGQYYYAVKDNRVVLIGYRFSGEVWDVSGDILIERKTQLRKELKNAMMRSI